MIKLNGYEIYPTIFPDGTSQVWKLTFDYKEFQSYNLVWDFESEGEIVHLYQLMNLLKHETAPKKTTLYMPYLPYARQDKPISNDSTFALTTFATLINGLHFDEVIVYDAHSNEAKKLINNLTSVEPVFNIREALKQTQADTIAYPDKGAHTRYSHLHPHVNQVTGNKTRDQLNGRITDYTYEGTMRPKIGDYVVQGPEGEFWFVNGVIFEKTYEEIDADS